MKFPFMKSSRKIISFIFLTLGLLFAAQSNAQSCKADLVLGNWISPNQDLIISCYKSNQKYFGKVVWFKKYHDQVEDLSKGIPESSWMNSVVMKHFSFHDGKWMDGEIHDLKSDKTYDSNIKLIDPNTVKITGYVLLPIFGESMIFKRYTNKELPPFESDDATTQGLSKCRTAK
jgi:uncharacterized protein (DUF2147 family)